MAESPKDLDTFEFSVCTSTLSAGISHIASAMDTVEEISSKCSRRAKLIHEIF